MVLNIDDLGRVHDEILLAIPSGPEKMTSFSKLVLKKGGRDAQHIRTLTIRDTAFNHRPEGSSPPKKDYSPCALLVDAIVHARNLRHINIERVETFLATVISGYQQLESIAFETVGCFSLSILRNMRSTPRSIKLREAGTLALADKLMSLEACAGSLEEFALINYAGGALDGSMTVWERVHTLNLVPARLPFPPSAASCIGLRIHKRSNRAPWKLRSGVWRSGMDGAASSRRLGHCTTRHALHTGLPPDPVAELRFPQSLCPTAPSHSTSAPPSTSSLYWSARQCV